MATKQPRRSAVRLLKVRGTRIPTVGARFFMARLPHNQTRRFTVRRIEGVLAIVPKAGKALDKPGIRKDAVFSDDAYGVYAYSVDEKDPTRFVRESADGKRSVGKLVRGRFKAG